MIKIKKATAYFLRSLLYLFLIVSIFIAITSKIPVFGLSSFVVASGSMAPALPTGGIVFIRPGLTYDVGDIISFKNPSGMTVTHRLVAKQVGIPENNYQVAGDANPQPDSVLVPHSEILGKSVFYLPYFGRLAGFIQSPTRFIGFLIVPALLFIVWQIYEIFQEYKKIIEKRFTA